ncbi:protein SNORC [Brienomyrus brachyistius]|uniref:protein SNORC n=1 Tax=Brienomyrus brachyistius TaxID=42636 RepID=UPI0020B3D528|nr:protein SNORC [Brienomyrus brachyistius]
MAAGCISTLLWLTVLSLCLAAAYSETGADAAPTVPHDEPEMSSGGGVYDITTKGPFHKHPETTFTFDYEDTTHTQDGHGEAGVLSPGAITAIVIAVILGASVLIALIVITLKKFTAA